MDHGALSVLLSRTLTVMPGFQGMTSKSNRLEATKIKFKLKLQRSKVICSYIYHLMSGSNTEDYKKLLVQQPGLGWSA
jgi:hypothetical protein